MDKVVMITGARRGLGAACAYKFLSQGFNVILNDFSQYFDELEVLKDNLEKEFSQKVMICCGDVSNEVDVKKMLNEVKEAFSSIDVLVNNAAIVEDMEVCERTTELFEKTLLNNVTGTYLMCKYFGNFMFEQEKVTRIINISSTNGIDCNFPTSIDYDASKAAVISLTKNFAIEYAPKVLVNSVAPGWMTTPMNDQLPKELIEEECSKIYLKRFADPKEISNLIYFLGSEENTYINSSIIVADGGY